MRFIFLRLAPLWATLSFSGPLHAAASLLVDDAGTTPDGHCQLESWARWHAGHQELAAVPACTLAGTEWSFGLGHLRGTGSAPWTLGAKRTLRAKHDERVQVAVGAEAGGDVRHGGAHGWAVNLPASIALDAATRVVVLANVGYSHTRAEHGMTLGIGSEINLAPRWSLLAEHWRDATRRRSSQLGMRRHLRDDTSLDLLAGRTHGTPSVSWITVGLNLPLSH